MTPKFQCSSMCNGFVFKYYSPVNVFTDIYCLSGNSILLKPKV